MDKHDVIVQAVERLKKSEFKATAIKVELEANLRRRSIDPAGCSDCYRGTLTCPECVGDYEGSYCGDCDGDGDFMCNACDGDGYTYDDDDDRIECEDCDGDGRIDCTDCEGSGCVDQCDQCDRGNIACPNCINQDSHMFGNVSYCQNYILRQLAEEGLAQSEDGVNFKPVHPLVFAKFYNDGSVDSELTFTLALDKAENIFLLPKFVDAFNELAKANGNDCVTTGAGMHMALLNEPDGRYPSSPSDADNARAANFEKSMQHLLPALYFLGSNDENSRSLNYRRPGVGRGSGSENKYKTVAWRGGSLEFRVFETCYKNPEAILDNVVVMSNTMKYWKTKYKPMSIQKIGQYNFGLDGTNKLERLYVSVEHIDLLNGGLKLLKPAYYTVKQLKKQRNFNRTRRYGQTRITQAKKDAVQSYKEYENRWTWAREMRELSDKYDLMQTKQNGARPIDDTAKAEIEKEVAKRMKNYEKTKTSLESYIDEKVRSISTNLGSYTLGRA